MPPSTVYILDDEPEMVKALTRLLRAKRFEVRGFTSVRAFLETCSPPEAACLVLDVAMPELDGLELQRRLTHQGILLPIIFLTGHGDIRMAVSALKKGAFDFVEKPFGDAALVERVRDALASDAEQQQKRSEGDSRGALLAALTPREQDVMHRVAAGKLNKVIADDMNVSMRTVEVYRARVYAKLGVRSAAELATLLAHTP